MQIIIGVILVVVCVIGWGYVFWRNGRKDVLKELLEAKEISHQTYKKYTV